MISNGRRNSVVAYEDASSAVKANQYTNSVSEKTTGGSMSGV